MATVHQVVGDNDQMGKWYKGSWTTESSAGDHTIIFPRHVLWFQAVLNSGGASPSMLMKHADESNESLQWLGTDTADSSSVVVLSNSEADATGVLITNYSNGTCTVKVDSTMQTASGTNQWIACCKP